MTSIRIHYAAVGYDGNIRDTLRTYQVLLVHNPQLTSLMAQLGHSTAASTTAERTITRVSLPASRLLWLPYSIACVVAK